MAMDVTIGIDMEDGVTMDVIDGIHMTIGAITI